MKAYDSTKVLRNADGWPASVKFVDGFANGWDDLLKERMVDEAGKVVEVKLEQRFSNRKYSNKDAAHRFLDHLVENQGDQVSVVGIRVTNKIAERGLS